MSEDRDNFSALISSKLEEYDRVANDHDGKGDEREDGHDDVPPHDHVTGLLAHGLLQVSPHPHLGWKEGVIQHRTRGEEGQTTQDRGSKRSDNIRRWEARLIQHPTEVRGGQSRPDGGRRGSHNSRRREGGVRQHEIERGGGQTTPDGLRRGSHNTRQREQEVRHHQTEEGVGQDQTLMPL